MFVDDLFNKKTLTESNGGGSPWHSEPEQQQMDADRRGRLGRERNAGLDEPDDVPSGAAPTGNGVYEYTVPAGQESTAQELGLQQHRGHWVSRVPIQRANFQFGRPQFHEIPSQGVAEGKEDKIAQLKKDYATAVHWSKNDTNPHKREAARQKAEKIKRHLETQYKQGVAEGLGKTIKRGMAGWGAFDKDKPADVVKRVKGQDTDTLKGLSNRGSTGKGSPAELQQKAIERELKKRGEQGVAEGPGFDKWADDRAASQLHKLNIPKTWVLNVMDAATGEHWAIEIQASSPDMAKERAQQQGYKVLRIKEKGVAEAEKKLHPKTWHDVDKKLGKAVDKMSQAEKVAKGFAHPDTLKKKGVAEVAPVTIGSKVPKSDTETFGLEKGRGYKINNPKDWKPGDRPRAVQQLIPTQDKKDHIRSRLGKHKSPVLPEQGVAEGNNPVAKIKAPRAPSSPALAAPKAPAVAETIAKVERMLESVTSKKSAEMVKAYVDQKFTELGLRNTTECRNLMTRVVQESAIRRRQHAKSLAK